MARSLIPLAFDAGFPTSRADPFLVLHREVNRLFDDALRGPAGGASVTAPRVNVSETDRDVRVEVELPGVSDQDVQVDLADDLLTIRGEKRVTREDAHHHVVERSFGGFARSIRLPFSPEPDRVQAGFSRGVLTITLPKSAPGSRVHRIRVRPGGGAGEGAEGGQSPGDRGAAAAAGHPTPDTTQSGATQSGRGGAGSASIGPGGVELNDQRRVAADPVLDNPGAGHPT